MSADHRRRTRGMERRGQRLERRCPSPVRHATLHSHEMGTRSSRASRASTLRPASRWPARGAVSCSRRVREAFPVQDVWEA
jgi:hypothetical protein